MPRQQPGQKRVDDVQRAVRAGAAPPPELAGLVRPGPGDPLALVLGVLAELQETVEALGGDLVGDPDVLARHLDALQSLDLVSQSLTATATLITADDEHRAAAMTALARLRARLSGA
jgi:hypothetical protein